MKLKNITFVAAIALPALANAQTVDFETNDYTNLGVYDRFENSLFNKNSLEGNVKVIANPLKDDINPSTNVLAIQRSRYGSNLFGAKITLTEPFDLDNTSPKSPKYVHVLLNKPVDGRAAVILLGNRKENNPEAIQIINLGKASVAANTWKDVVFPVFGSNGVRVTSIVVVPDCESTYSTSTDFMAYVDGVVVNKSSQSRTHSRTDYPLNYDDESTKTGNTGRHINSFMLNGTISGSKTLTPLSSNYSHIYNDMTASPAFVAMPGEKITPTIKAEGSWQNGYIYIDYNQDGKITPTLNADYTIPEGSELVSYSYIETIENKEGYKADGTKLTGGDRNTLACPAFTIPSTTASGYYRIRVKTDWGSQDPGGSTTSDANNLLQNGGTIIDALIKVHKERENLIIQTRNGEVLATDGSELGNEVTYGKALTVKLSPALGFKQAGFILRHGYNLDGDSIIHSNKQWSEVVISASDVNSDGTYTIPASLVDGGIMINAEFASATGISKVKNSAKEKVSAKAVKGGIQIKGNKVPFVVTTVDGKNIVKGVVNGSKTIALAVGVYMVNNQKLICK